MRNEARVSAWSIAGAVSAFAIMLWLLWTYTPLIHLAWLVINGYDIHIH